MKHFLEEQTKKLENQLAIGEVPENKQWYVEQLIEWNKQDLKNL